MANPVAFFNQRSLPQEAPPKLLLGSSSRSLTSQASTNPDSNLSSHKTFSCVKCGKTFPRHSRLQIHERTHTGERPYQCPYEDCHKAFSEKGNLKTHIRIHTGERPYFCKHPGCGSTFITRGHLKDHSRMHTNDRPYICANCGKGFMRSTTLKVHLRVHSGERPYACPYPGCGKTFTESGNLNTHKKLHAGEDLPEELKMPKNAMQKKSKAKERKLQTVSAFTPYKPNSETEKLDKLNFFLSNIERPKSPRKTAFKSEVGTELYTTVKPQNGTMERLSVNCPCLPSYNPYGMLVGGSIPYPIVNPTRTQGFNELSAVINSRDIKSVPTLPYPIENFKNPSLYTREFESVMGLFLKGYDAHK